jgi:hypothetical protein
MHVGYQPHRASADHNAEGDQKNVSFHGWFSFADSGRGSMMDGLMVSIGRWTASSSATTDWSSFTRPSN